MGDKQQGGNTFQANAANQHQQLDAIEAQIKEVEKKQALWARQDGDEAIRRQEEHIANTEAKLKQQQEVILQPACIKRQRTQRVAVCATDSSEPPCAPDSGKPSSASPSKMPVTAPTPKKLSMKKK